MYTSKQHFHKSKEPFHKSKQTFQKSKQTFRKSKQTFRKSKQTFRKSKQPFRRRPWVGPRDRIDYRNMSLINRFISELIFVRCLQAIYPRETLVIESN